jgi:hypothetical protein
LAGAAIIGGGYMAWHEHEKKKTEEEVCNFPYILTFFNLFASFTYASFEETSPYVGCARLAQGLLYTH